MASIKLGDLLVRAQVPQEPQLKSALQEQKKHGGKLGEILVRMGFATEDLITRALAKQLNVPVVNLDTIKALPSEVKGLLTLRLMKDLGVLPLQLRDEKTLVVAMTEPTSSVQLELLRSETKLRIVPQVASPSAMTRAIHRLFEATPAGALELDDESSFKLIDSHGKTVVRPALSPQMLQQRAPEPAPSRAAPAARASADSTTALLDQLEQMQRQEVTTLKAVVELLIQKGVFSRDEYLAKLKR